MMHNRGIDTIKLSNTTEATSFAETGDVSTGGAIMDRRSRQASQNGNAEVEIQGKRDAGMVVSVRLTAQEADRLQGLARNSGKSVSDIARESLRATLNHEAAPVLPPGLTATVNSGAPLTVFSGLTSTTSVPALESDVKFVTSR